MISLANEITGDFIFLIMFISYYISNKTKNFNVYTIRSHMEFLWIYSLNKWSYMNKYDHYNVIYNSEILRTFYSKSLECSWTLSNRCYYNLEIVPPGGNRESLIYESKKFSLQASRAQSWWNVRWVCFSQWIHHANKEIQVLEINYFLEKQNK